MSRWALPRAILADRGLRAAAGLAFLLGATVCTFGPYVAQLAVERFALGDRGYAAMMVFTTFVSVTAAMWVGIRSDQTGRRRSLALWAAGLLAAGAALMTFLPSAVSFVLAHGLILPASSLFGQVFALGRIAAQRLPDDTRDSVLATIRALFALPFVLILPLWALAFRAGLPVLAIYPAGLVMTLVMLGLAWAWWPADRDLAPLAQRSGLSLGAALIELTHPSIALRLLALGAIGAVGPTYWAVLSLILTPAIGRGTADVALYVGLVAGAEVPFMLAMSRLTRRQGRATALMIGTSIYSLHLVGLPMLAPTPWLWALVLPAAWGGAYIYTLPIAYLQNLLSGRPGTGSALLSLQKLVGDLIAAGCFAVGTALSGYGLVAVLGAVAALIGALALVLADRRAKAPSAS